VSQEVNDGLQQRQFQQLTEALCDPAPAVRAAAAGGVCALLDRYWELMPHATVAAFLQRLCGARNCIAIVRTFAFTFIKPWVLWHRAPAASSKHRTCNPPAPIHAFAPPKLSIGGCPQLLQPVTLARLRTQTPTLDLSCPLSPCSVRCITVTA